MSVIGNKWVVDVKFFVECLWIKKNIIVLKKIVVNLLLVIVV